MSRLRLNLLRILMLTTLPAVAWYAQPQTNAPQVADLLKRLARPAPSTIAFAEVRFSPLLREPLIVAGELGYAGPASLDRRVAQPYREDTQIRGESVRVSREGEPVRSFALKRAPELRGLLTGFAALLAGDHASLEKNFTIATSGDAGRWTIELIPLDVRTRRRLSRIRIDGRDDAPRCFALLTGSSAGDQGASIMLLGEIARKPLPPQVTRAAIERLCTSDSPPPAA